MQQGGLRTVDKNSRQPKVSVVTVTYNAAQTLPQLVDSIRRHKSDDIEFVVIDGNSTDETLDILKVNNDVIDFWVSEPDKGIYDAMNKSLKYFRGQWVVFWVPMIC